jgi:histone H3/H4
LACADQTTNHRANENAQNANRKTIAPADVFKALEELEFDFKERLEAELASTTL